MSSPTKSDNKIITLSNTDNLLENNLQINIKHNKNKQKNRNNNKNILITNESSKESKEYNKNENLILDPNINNIEKLEIKQTKYFGYFSKDTQYLKYHVQLYFKSFCRKNNLSIYLERSLSNIISDLDLDLDLELDKYYNCDDVFLILIKVDNISNFADKNNYDNYSDNYDIENIIKQKINCILNEIINSKYSINYTENDKKMYNIQDFKSHYEKDILTHYRISFIKIPIKYLFQYYNILSIELNSNELNCNLDPILYDLKKLYDNHINNNIDKDNIIIIDNNNYSSILCKLFNGINNNIINKGLFNDIEYYRNTKVIFNNEIFDKCIFTFHVIAESWKNIESLTVEDFIPVSYLIIKNKNKNKDYITNILNNHFIIQSKIITFYKYFKNHYVDPKTIYIINLIGNSNLEEGIIKFKIDFDNNKIIYKFHNNLIQKIINNEITLSNLSMKYLFNSHNLINYPIEKCDILNNNLEIESIEIFLNNIGIKNKQKLLNNISIEELNDKINNFNCLFEYQKENIKWMTAIENKVRNKELFINTNIKYNCIIVGNNYQIITLKDKKYINAKYPMNLENWCFNKSNNFIYKNNKIFSREEWKYYINNNIGLLPLEEFNKINEQKIYFQGGILCDDVGLGKTLSMICHIVNNLEKDKKDYLENKFEVNNLIILPNRLITQWKYELDKYVKNNINLRILTLMTITDIKKLQGQNISQYDIIILHKNIISNNKYVEYLNECSKIIKNNSTNNNISNIKKIRISNKKLKELSSINQLIHDKQIDYFDLYNIKFNRIIIDEIHEVINPYITDFNNYLHIENNNIKNYFKNYKNHKKYKEKDENMIFNLYNIKTNFKWGITATPFNNGYNNYIGILRFLSNYNIDNNLDITQNINTNNNIDILFKIVYKYYNIYDKDIDNFDNKEIKLIKKNYYKFLYNNKYFDEKIIYYDPYLYILGMDGNDVIKLYSILIKQTLKKNVKNQINIPLFTEKNIFIDLSNEERNIYNTMLSHSNFHTQKYLFKLCTNLLVINYFNTIFNGNNILTEDNLDDIIPNIDLNKLQEYMIEKLKELYKKQQEKYQKIIDNIELHKEKINVFHNAIIYLEQNNYNNIFDEKNKLYNNKLEKQIIKNLEDNYSFYKDNIQSITYFKDEQNIYNLYLSNRMENNYNIKTLDYIIYQSFKKMYDNYKRIIKNNQDNLQEIKKDIQVIPLQIILFQKNDFLKEKTSEPCIICYEDIDKFIITKCRHIFCWNCFNTLMSKSSNGNINCPECRTVINENDVSKSSLNNQNNQDNQDILQNNQINNYSQELQFGNIKLQSNWKKECINKYGTKMSVLIQYLADLFKIPNNRVIIFSQYKQMLKLIGECLNNYQIKHVFCNGNVYKINKNIDLFKRDPTIRIIMLSSETCNSGNNLTEANHVIFIDVLNYPKKNVMDIEKQAIGRTVRLGQKQPVIITRFITNNTIEFNKYNENKYDINTFQ